MPVTFNKPGFKKVSHSENTYVEVEKVTKSGEVLPLHSEDTVKGVVLQTSEPSKVGVNAGLTINTGDFSSLKIAVSIYRPCNPTKEDEDECFEYCRTWVAEKVVVLQSTFLES